MEMKMLVLQPWIMACVAMVVVALLQWAALAALYRRRLEVMKVHYRAERTLASTLLSQCRQQITQLQAEHSQALQLARTIARQAPETPRFAERESPGSFVSSRAFADTEVSEAFADTEVCELSDRTPLSRLDPASFPGRRH